MGCGQSGHDQTFVASIKTFHPILDFIPRGNPDHVHVCAIIITIPTSDINHVSFPSLSPHTQSKLRINNKSDVVIEETKVHAQHHTYQEDDLMSFSISPAAVMATRKDRASTPPSNSSRDDNNTSSKSQDLIKFSLSSEDLAKLQTKRWNTAPTSRMKPRDPHLTSHEFSTKSHDNRREISTKLDQRETKFGSTPNQLTPKASHGVNRSGVASDVDQWKVLSLKGPEKALGSEANTTGTKMSQLSVHTCGLAARTIMELIIIIIMICPL